MDAPTDALAPTDIADGRVDLETIFVAHYGRICRVLARVVRDRARAEELAVDVFLRWSRQPPADADGAPGWLYRTAVRIGLDELRRESRRARYGRLIAAVVGSAPTPEDVRAAGEAQRRVRMVLAALRRRQAELLVLRSQGLAYQELAATLGLNPSSIGTLLSRAQQAFRKEYVRRYGQD